MGECGMSCESAFKWSARLEKRYISTVHLPFILLQWHVGVPFLKRVQMIKHGANNLHCKRLRLTLYSPFWYQLSKDLSAVRITKQFESAAN